MGVLLNKELINTYGATIQDYIGSKYQPYLRGADIDDDEYSKMYRMIGDMHTILNMKVWVLIPHGTNQLIINIDLEVPNG